MLRTRVIPTLLLQDNVLVKTVRFKQASYVGDPRNTVRIFNEKEVDEIIILDITASKKKRQINFKLIEQLASECFMPMAYGGGIHSVDDAKRLFALGVEKVSLNTAVFDNPALVTELAKEFGSQSIVGAMDVKKPWLSSNKVYRLGKTNTKRSPVEHAQYLEHLGVGEILLTAIDQEGTFQGYDLELTQQVVDAVSVPVITSGGAGDVEHLRQGVKEAGASAVGVGSMVVYQNPSRSVLIRFPERKLLDDILN